MKKGDKVRIKNLTSFKYSYCKEHTGKIGTVIRTAEDNDVFIHINNGIDLYFSQEEVEPVKEKQFNENMTQFSKGDKVKFGRHPYKYDGENQEGKIGTICNVEGDDVLVEFINDNNEKKKIYNGII